MKSGKDTRKGTAARVRSGRLVGARRERISGAMWDLNAALYTLRDHYKRDWTDSCFKNLRYLVRLAKKAP